MAVKISKPIYPGLYYFDTFTFTTLGTTGHRGPDSSKGYANAPWREGDFSITDGQQQWTVPATGTYTITAAGAYGAYPGRVVSGNVSLNEGQTLTMLIGQEPTPLTANVADGTTVGGGGGTFVSTGQQLLIVAGGGDGTGGRAASFGPYGSGDGKNGGGYLSNGLATNATFKFLRPEAYVNGGFGTIFPTGVVPEEGGLGGGQAPVTSGVSGGGGYTGSLADGVSGATCYADATVQNFTDLGTASNTSGYVTVSLIDPTPITQKWSWDTTKQWTMTNAVASGLNTPVWSSTLGLFIATANFAQVATSSDGETWSAVKTNLPVPVTYNESYTLGASTSGILIAVSTRTGYVYRSTDAVSWTLVLSSSINGSYIFFLNNLFILRGTDNATTYTSTDGITWTTITPNVMFSSITYGGSQYVMVGGLGALYTSTDLTTWSAVSDSNVTTSINGWQSVLFDNQTFVALRGSSPRAPSFATLNSSMSPRPQIMINNPIYNITSLTFTGSWGSTQARVGDTLTFANITNFLYTISPATYGTVTSVDSGSVTISIASSTISVAGSGFDSLTLNFTPTGTTYVVVTSSDGSNWFGRTAPTSSNWTTLVSGGGSFMALSYFNGSAMCSLDNGTTWKLSTGFQTGAVYGVYSPTLKYFLFTDGSNFYLSLDGSIIIPSVSGGTVGNPVQLIWADTLGLVVAVSAYSIMTSPDGVNWTLVLNLNPSGGSDVTGATVTWSRDLGLLVAYFRNTNTSNSPLVYTSTDGVTWSRTVLAQSFPIVSASINPCKPCWSPQLGLFTIGKAFSRDGINWTFGSGPSLACAAWSASLQLFTGSDGTYTYYSTDGINWTSVNSYGVYSIAWSASLGLFVGVGEQSPSSSPFLIYTSSSGTSWTQVYSDVASSAYAWYGSVAWATELKLFVCIYQQVSSVNGLRVLISSNGTTWTSPGNNIINGLTGSDLIWSPELETFVFTTQKSQPGMFISMATSTF